jgi:hypothetical protein
LRNDDDVDDDGSSSHRYSMMTSGYRMLYGRSVSALPAAAAAAECILLHIPFLGKEIAATRGDLRLWPW